jgi:hypothetical protein
VNGRIVLGGVCALILALAGPVAGQEVCMAPTIQQAKAKHEQRLLAMPGVVSVGIGLDAHGSAVIVVGLDGPRPETVKNLPTHLDGYAVETRIIGPLKAQEP